MLPPHTNGQQRESVKQTYTPNILRPIGLFIARLFQLQTRPGPGPGPVTPQSNAQEQQENIQQTFEHTHSLRIIGLSISCSDLSVERGSSEEGKPVIEVWAGNTKIKRMILNQSASSWTMRSQFGLQASVPTFDFAFAFELEEDCTEVGTVKLVTADLLKHAASSQEVSSSITIKAERNPRLEMVFTYTIIPSNPSKATFTEVDHSPSVSSLARLPLADSSRIEMPGNRRNLDEAIQEHKSLVDKTPADHPDKPHRLRTLGALYVRRFTRVKDIKDLHEAITVQRSAASLITLTDGQLKAGHLGDLADYLSIRFDLRKNPSDLDEAISALDEATQFMGCSDVAKPCHLDTLGYLLSRRFDLSKNLLDIDHAVSTHESSVRLTPNGHAHRISHLSNLGNTYAKRFQHTRGAADLDNAITTLQEVAHLSHDSGVDEPHRLMKLGDLYHDRYTQFKREADLDLAIACHEDCVHLTSPSEACLFFHLNRLRILHRHRFQVSGNRADLDAAIALHERAVSISPRGDRPAQLNVLGSSYLARYNRYRDIRDIDQAVFRHQEAVDLTTDAHQRIGRLVNLGIAFKNRFMATGNISDIDHAISAHKDALSSTQDGDPDKPCRLHNLATAYICRFEYFHEPQDIEEALSVDKNCVDATPPNHFHESSHLHSLGIALRLHFDRSGNRTNLDDAIEKHERAVQITPKHDQFRAMRLNSLGNAFVKRSEVTGDLSDLHRGISALDNATRCSRVDDPELPCLSNNIGSAYMTLFSRSGLCSDIDRAIHSFQTGIRQMSGSHVRCAGHLSNLANAYSTRFQNFHDRDDLEASITRYRIAACSSSASPTLRLNAAIQWAQVAKSVHVEGVPISLEGYAVAIELLPRVAWLGRTVSSRYQELASLGSFCNEAAAVAITSGKYDMALEWLEVGRSIVWGQLLHLRTPLDDLRAVDSKLADELELVSVKLERAGREDSESVSQSHHQLAQEWEVLADKVRALPGFEDFLQPKKLKQLSCAARLGPIVVINVHELRCDALVLHSEHIMHVPLDTFSFSLGQDLRRALNQELSRADVRSRYTEMRATAPASSYIEHSAFPRILSCLWMTIVEPVLTSLKYTVPVPQDDPPRLWWCATGPLAFLPLHAAGIYDSNNPGPTVLDYVVSSYTPTISTLLERPKDAERKFLGLLAIIQPNTPGQNPLPNTKKELEILRQQVPGSGLQCLEGPSALKETVLQGLETNSWVHLASHAIQDISTPTESGFCVHDGRLSLSTIITKSLPHADFAFLSACQTAAGDEKLSEEAVHLAAAMLFVGFRGVIATMWSIMDKDAPLVAEKVYSELFGGSKPDSKKAARALHHAIKHLRRESGDSRFLSWVPFIHVGI